YGKRLGGSLVLPAGRSKFAGGFAAVASAEGFIDGSIDGVAHIPNRPVPEAGVNSCGVIAAGIEGLRSVVRDRRLRRLLEGDALIDLGVANRGIGRIQRREPTVAFPGVAIASAEVIRA